MSDDALSAGAVARRLGVAVTTLRTWHQRYGLGPSQHLPGHHRRYTAEDLTRLETMCRLTAEGVPPAEAARWARRTVELPAPAGTTVTTPRRPAPPRAGGGFAIPVGRAGPAARGLARAAVRLDSTGMRDIIERHIEAHGVVAAWDEVVRPVLVGIGERHAATARLIEVEHLLSRSVSEVLSAVRRPAAGRGAPQVLLSCADEEQHSLPLEALATALAQAGTACRLFGARMPTTALVDAVTRTGPAVVVLWSHLPATAAPAQLSAVLAAPGRPVLLLAAGPGWQIETLPVGVLSPVDLSQAVALTVAATDRSGIGWKYPQVG